MSKPDPRPEGDRDVLDELGDLISERIKKGRAKLEELIDEAKRNKGKAKDDDDGDFMGYFRVFLDDPAVAAVTPSSKFIVERVVKAMDLADAKLIVEYGAAQGVITRQILKKMRPDAKLVAIEFNQKLYEELIATVKDDRLIPVHGDVREIDKILARVGMTGPVDAVTSGVPFSYFSNRGRHELLLKTTEILRPGGRFVPYQVTTHLIPLLKDYFSDVDTQFEVRNIPPHFVFTAIK